MSRWLACDFFLRSSKQTPSVRRRGPRVFVSFQFLRYLGTFLGEAASVFISLSSNNTFFFLRLGSRARVRELSQFSGNSTREGMFADDAARGRPVRPFVRPFARPSVCSSAQHSAANSGACPFSDSVARGEGTRAKNAADMQRRTAAGTPQSRTLRKPRPHFRFIPLNPGFLPLLLLPLVLQRLHTFTGAFRK